MSKLISTIYKSLVRAVSDAIKEVEATTGIQAEYWSWESRSDENDMPTKTLLGLDGYTFDENNGLWTVRCGITLSTYNDRNLMDEAEILDVLHELFGMKKKVTLRKPGSGDPFSELGIVEFRVMPMGQSELRNYRMVALELLRTDTSTPD